MKQQKDIGTLFKTKLEDGGKSPSSELWDRIEDSLDKGDKKRKGIVLFWLISMGIPIFLTAAWLSFTPNDTPILHKVTTKKSAEQENFKLKELNVPLLDSLTEIKASSKKPIKDTSEIKTLSSNRENLEKNPIDNSKTKKNVASNQIEPSGKEQISEDGFMVKSTYHYFNSETEKSIETPYKKTIDSIINKKDTVNDSLGEVFIQKKDSL